MKYRRETRAGEYELMTSGAMQSAGTFLNLICGSNRKAAISQQYQRMAAQRHSCAMLFSTGALQQRL